MVASVAHADGGAHRRHAKTTLVIDITAAESLPAHPRIPVREESLAPDKLEKLLRATDPNHREAVKAAALDICAGIEISMAACRDIIARANVFLDEHSLVEEAGK
jgi:hypothetical protein